MKRTGEEKNIVLKKRVGIKAFKFEGDLAVINVSSLVLVAAAFFLQASPLNIMIGFPFILFFPGYTLVCALFPKKKDLGLSERLGLSIGLSIIIVPLIGLALNFTPWGVDIYAILPLLLIFILSMSAITVYRRKSLSVDEKFYPYFSLNMTWWKKLNRLNVLTSTVLITGIVVISGLTAYFELNPGIGDGFTEFYLLGPGRKIEDYPTNLTSGESYTVILGVRNHENVETVYRIIMELENEITGTIDNIRVNHDEEWEQNVTFTPQKDGDHMKLEFLLYKNDEQEPYRHLHIWITVSS